LEKTSNTINVTINGRDTELPFETTVSGYLASCDLKERLVAVELNGSILSRSLFASTVFEAGDRVEIVHFVGGG
jgi:sulfur carrier protein